MNKWTISAVDRTVIRELRGFLPEKVFDMHAHLYRVADIRPKKGSGFDGGPGRVTASVWRRRLGEQVGASRLAGGMFMPIPRYERSMDKCNDFLVSELEKEREGRGLILISPRYSQTRVLEYLENPRVVGFKPYHLLGRVKKSFEARIERYLPEWAWKLAHDRGLIITLHMVRLRALSDPDNLKTITRMCAKYPNARLVLAHAARGFHPANTLRALPALRGLANIWFDTAAICEPAALVGILEEFGPGRLMWGSDFPVSQLPGKCVAAGDGFVWLLPQTVRWDKVIPTCKPILCGIESLVALKQAADIFGLGPDDLCAVFHDNGRALLGLHKRPGTVTRDLYCRAKDRIPGGVQLLSKRPEMFAPGQWPAYYREARGCETWDLDGRHYYDMSLSGISSCLLGFRDPDVTRAVRRQLHLGGMSTLNPPDEVELADLLCEIHPWAEQVRFLRTGGECAAAAIRVARATTDRSMIAMCGYHGWHDWYLAANLGGDDALRGHLLPGLDPLGVPRELRGTTIPFQYNDRAAFQSILDQHGGRLAAVIMEPCRHQDPEPGFLEFVRDGIRRCGGLLIFDEISIGWRLCLGGAHLKLGIDPDMAVFAKAMSNGHPMAAIIGTRAAMAGAHTSFISSTYWTEAIGPAAALATIRKMQRIDVPAHVARMGALVSGAWKAHAQKHGLPVVVPDAYECLPHFEFDHELKGELKTLYIQLMLERGFLAGLLFSPTLAHTEAVVSLFSAAIDDVFREIASALSAGNVRERLKGPVAHVGFRRLL